MEKEFERRLRRSLVAKKVFTPAAPISRKTLFAGRHDQLTRAVSVINQPGRHAIVFGERGVGKTSLVSVLHYFYPSASPEEELKICTARVNANADHTFDSLWREIFGKIPLIQDEQTPAGYTSEPRTTVASHAELVADTPITPSVVENLLSHAAARSTVIVVVIDEFDRVVNSDIRRLTADTIKTLSDHTVPATLIVVGVADTVEELVGEHQSIQRALEQIQMPRMSGEEISEIITGGISAFNLLCKDFKISITDEGKGILAFFARGMPSFAHLIGLNAALEAIQREKPKIDQVCVLESMENALKGVEHSTSAAYQRAVSSAHKTNLYRQVLTACALASGDEMGFFAAADVREPLTNILKRPADIPTFMNHLDEFCSEKRGPILQRKGEMRNRRFRFIDPMMEAYVVMRGFADNIVPIPKQSDGTEKVD